MEESPIATPNLALLNPYKTALKYFAGLEPAIELARQDLAHAIGLLPRKDDYTESCLIHFDALAAVIRHASPERQLTVRGSRLWMMAHDDFAVFLADAKSVLKTAEASAEQRAWWGAAKKMEKLSVVVEGRIRELSRKLDSWKPNAFEAEFRAALVRHAAAEAFLEAIAGDPSVQLKQKQLKELLYSYSRTKEPERGLAFVEAYQEYLAMPSVDASIAAHGPKDGFRLSGELSASLMLEATHVL